MSISENIFKVNEFLTVKLKSGRVNIYVKNKLFNQCTLVIVQQKADKIKNLAFLQSIDELAENQLYEGDLNEEPYILLETEFFVHCSNLQAWYENEYDTRLLHSNLSFPLLKKLTEVGDLKAKKIFKEEIAMRISSGELNVVLFLISNGYLNYLRNSEIKTMVESPEYVLFDKLFKVIIKYYKDDDFSKELKSVYSILETGEDFKYSRVETIEHRRHYSRHKLEKLIYFSLRKKLKEIFRAQNFSELIIFLKDDILVLSLSEKYFLTLLSDLEFGFIKNIVKVLKRNPEQIHTIFNINGVDCDFHGIWSMFPNKFNYLSKDIIRAQVVEIAEKGEPEVVFTLMLSHLLDFLEFGDIKHLMHGFSNILLEYASIIQYGEFIQKPFDSDYDHVSIGYIFNLASSNRNYLLNFYNFLKKEQEYSKLLKHFDTGTYYWEVLINEDEDDSFFDDLEIFKDKISKTKAKQKLKKKR